MPVSLFRKYPELTKAAKTCNAKLICECDLDIDKIKSKYKATKNLSKEADPKMVEFALDALEASYNRSYNPLGYQCTQIQI
ncbi:hypothetical protein BdWA1_001044 [Babesia duncani]|uniref:Uncharacterized protein n=1 Tax=Babesia duncani TaxID=323732 RepID=A0AAD9UQM3_9APIC|nr:hypothetical protein BdWA1_001044 [Babesia duncani]